MKLLRSFGYALSGIQYCFRSERNFRLHVASTFMALILSFACAISDMEWIAVCFCIALVIVMEMLNTAIEKLCDVVHREFDPSIKKVKDMAAGAVLVSAIFSVLTGLIIFLPKIIIIIKSI